jgi:hypothetical protein
MDSAAEATHRTRRFVVGGLLLAAGALLLVGSLLARGDYPPGLSTPFAMVLAMSAIVCLGTGVVALGFPPGPATQSAPSKFAVVGLALGILNAIVFAWLVGTNLSMNADTTIPAAARWVPVAIGGAAAALAIVGLLTARGDGPTRRSSIAAILLGVGPALTVLWLASSYCWVFVDRATSCQMP